MSTVFLLWHSRETDVGESDDRLIGVYSSEAEAEAAKVRKLQHQGFRDHPAGFCIAAYELNRDAWSEGFMVGPGGRSSSLH